MSKYASAPAFPFQIAATTDCVGLLGENLEAGDNITYTGMTMRQYAAIKILAGLVSRDGPPVVEYEAALAVKLADALLAELEK